MKEKFFHRDYKGNLLIEFERDIKSNVVLDVNSSSEYIEIKQSIKSFFKKFETKELENERLKTVILLEEKNTMLNFLSFIIALFFSIALPIIMKYFFDDKPSTINPAIPLLIQFFIIVVLILIGSFWVRYGIKIVIAEIWDMFYYPTKVAIYNRLKLECIEEILLERTSQEIEIDSTEIK